MSLPPFDFQREREVYPNDCSVETTISIVAFFRRFTFAYSRPMRRAEARGTTAEIFFEDE